MKTVKDLWSRWSRRINALTLRERTIMFISIAAALGAAADALVLSPQLAVQHALASRTLAQVGELASLRAQWGAVASPAQADTPQGRLHLRMNQTQARRDEVEQAIAQRLARNDGAVRLPDLLERVLRRQARLTLLRLDTAAPPAAPAASSAPLPRQGVELQIGGRYADFISYLAEIEQQMPGLRWTELRIDSSTQPPVLTVRVFLPGVAP
jgi:MSHA biogenesis protein MshJ